MASKKTTDLNSTPNAVPTLRAPRRKSAGSPAAPRARKRVAAVTPEATDSAPSQPVVTDDDIRVRAYFLSLEYSGNGMQDVDFWLLAERQLKSDASSTK